MTINEIRAANRAAGGHYFEASTLRFFRSQIERSVYSGPGGIYFVTSEQFIGSQGSSPRKWTVRKFNPQTASIDTVGEFNVLSREDAMAKARQMAKGEAQ